jgi:hypothetical protein
MSTNLVGVAGLMPKGMTRCVELCLRFCPVRRGLTQTELRNKVVFHVPSGLFESRGKTDWWSKLVQLDLEAKGLILRESKSKPLRWHRV